MLGTIQGQHFVACRECGNQWTTYTSIGPSLADEAGQGALFGGGSDKAFTGAGDERRDAGIEAAVSKRRALTWFAKEIALDLGRYGSTVCMDDVQRKLVEAGHTPGDLGNAAGSVFRGKGWVCVGFRNSKRDARQSGANRVWLRVEFHIPTGDEHALA